MPCFVPDELINDVMIALICERFHKLPSDLANENPREIQRMWAVLGEIDRIRKMQAK